MALDGRRAFAGAAVVASLVLADPRFALAWLGREHRALGAEAYVAACGRLQQARDRDPQIAQRYDIACGNLEVTSLLYGQGNAVSGDWVGQSSDLLDEVGAIAVVKKTNYWRLALRNSAHFHPLATRVWREFHVQAITDALAASRMQGAEQLERFEQAFAESAFGDHFLQDSFAAGHMGFNRPASSASAAKAFHDEWNERGRRIVNRRGDTWVTYGDGRLANPESKAARAHVLAACTESTYAVLVAFVLGERDPAPDLEVWSRVPFTIDDQELLPTLEAMFSESETLERPRALPLLAVKRPAVKDGVLAGWSAFTMSFDDAEHPVGSLVFGGDLVIPRVGARVEAGAGIAFEDDLENLGFAVDAGVVVPIALSFDGLFSHELDLGALLVIRDGVGAVARLGYRVNLEAGDWLLRPEVGPAYDIGTSELGFYVSFGIGKTTSAAGGGGFF